MEQTQAVVIDNGSFTIKSGYAGDDAPRSIIPSVAGTKKYKDVMFLRTPTVEYGDAAMNHRGCMELEYPIKHGAIVNWEAMEQVWSKVFYHELRILPEATPVLMSYSPLGPKKDKEKTIEVLMEKFNVPCAYLALTSILTVYASGRGSGLAVDSGEGVTTVVPVYEGFSMSQSWNRLNFGGEDLNKYLLKLLTERGYYFNTSAEMEIVRDIKEKLCFTSLNYEDDLEKTQVSNSLEQSYELPDGQVITLSSERFRTCEAMFKPSMMGLEQPGIHELIHECLQKCDMHTKKTLYCNVILSGGNTMFPEISTRIEKELKALAPSAMRVHTVAPPERLSSVWIGGSILSSLSHAVTREWISREEYLESGASIVHRYCPLS